MPLLRDLLHSEFDTLLRQCPHTQACQHTKLSSAMCSQCRLTSFHITALVFIHAIIMIVHTMVMITMCVNPAMAVLLSAALFCEDVISDTNKASIPGDAKQHKCYV